MDDLWNSVHLFGDWKMTGENAMTLCPFHQEDTPSFSINLKTGLWHCYGCGASGTAEGLNDLLGYTVFNPSTLELTEGPPYLWPFYEYPLAFDHPYLVKRQVSNDFVEFFHITAWDDGIYFPLHNEKREIIGWMRRRLKAKGPRYIYYGMRPYAWPFNGMPDYRFTPGQTVVVTEGIFGALRAMKFGHVAMTSLGASVGYRVFRWFHPDLFNVLFVFDDDYAGYIGAAKALEWAGRLKIRVVVPGREADELDQDGWFNVASGLVDSVGDELDCFDALAARSESPERFWRELKNFRKKLQQKNLGRWFIPGGRTGKGVNGVWRTT